MARQLWLLRHAEAEPHGAREDAARRLTSRGEQQAVAAGAALARMEISFDGVLVSPKVRARQTAEIAVGQWAEELGDRLELHEPLTGGFDGGDALEVLARFAADARVLLVGHEPDLSTVVAQLAGARIDLKKGGLAVLRLDGGSAELILLMRPRELAAIAGVPLGGE